MNKTSTTDSLMNFSTNSDELFRFADEEFSEEPRQHVIDSLLRYSRSLEVKSSSHVGFIESVKN